MGPFRLTNAIPPSIFDSCSMREHATGSAACLQAWTDTIRADPAPQQNASLVVWLKITESLSEWSKRVGSSVR